MRKIFLSTLLLVITLISAFAQYPGWVTTPEVNGCDVTFRITAPKAVSVKVYGDFLPGVNEYNLGGSVNMREVNGVWEYTAKNLNPDFYFYYFEVDGIKVLDPTNLRLVCNYSEFYNSFLVRGEQSKNFVTNDVNKGEFRTIWYDSPEYGGRRRMNVYLPYNYDVKKKYPVLYMFPGGGDDEDTWVDMGRLPQIMDHMIADKQAEEMIIVMVNAMPNQWAAPNVLDVIPGAKYHFEIMGTPEGKTGGQFVNDLTRNIIPYVESHFSVKKGRDYRAVCGVSMGGVYESYILENMPELFGSWAYFGSGIMSGTEESINALLAPVKSRGYNLMFVAAGEIDMAINSARNLMAGLDRNSMKYTYYDSKDGHNWRSWRRDLQELVKVLFK